MKITFLNFRADGKKVIDLTDDRNIHVLTNCFKLRDGTCADGFINQLKSEQTGAQPGTEDDFFNLVKGSCIAKGIYRFFRRTQSATLGLDNAKEYDIFVEVMADIDIIESLK